MKANITEEDMLKRPNCTLLRSLDPEHKNAWLSSEINRRGVAEEWFLIDADKDETDELKICTIEAALLFYSTITYIDHYAQFALIDALCYKFPPLTKLLFNEIRMYFFPEIQRIVFGGFIDSSRLYELAREDK